VLRLIEFAQAIVQQQYDPVAFLEEQLRYPHRLWWPAWLWRAATAGGVLVVLSFVARWNRPYAQEMALYVSSVWVIFHMLSGLVIMTIGQPQFWLLYAYSPPIWMLILFCGFAPLSPVCFLLGKAGLPLLLGAFVSNVGTLWVYKRVKEIRRDRQRMRGGGSAAELPALAWWEMIRWMRLIAAFGLAIIGLLFQDGIFVVAAVVGGLHLHVTLAAWIWNLPMVQFDQQRGRWRVTYIGRSTLFVPLILVRPLLALSGHDLGAALLALLQGCCLGPIVRGTIRKLSPTQVHDLILHLSLQEGGAGAIRYLEPALPQAIRPAAACYAALARESSKPPDLQHWVTALTNLPSAIEVGSEADTFQMLYKVRNALLMFTYDQAIDAAIDDLQRFIQPLYDLQLPPPRERLITQSETLPLTWPAAILFHLEMQRGRLQA
jgi:hypothetical protein